MKRLANAAVTRTAAHPRGLELLSRARLRMPGGVNSNVRLDAPPTFFEKGAGAWLWDVDGNDYVDYLLGQGPNFLGHANPEVGRAVARACESGTLFAGQHPLEVEAAESICATLGWAEMVRLGSSGTEMVQAAIRLARATTGRRLFIRFEGHYHGWLDNMLIKVDGDGATASSAGQITEYLADSIVLPWNDLAAVQRAFDERGGEIAAVITEPVMLNAGSIVPRDGYLDGLRDLCTKNRSILIFDEVISGFRVALGGAADRLGVIPDLAVYGKALAGGWPVAALAGGKDTMERFGTGEVNHSGTFNGSVMAAAAVIASIKVLTEDPPYERTERHGEAVQSGLVELGRTYGLPIRTQGPGMAFHVSLGDPRPVHDYRELTALDGAGYARLADEFVKAGIWVARRGIWYVSIAHGPNELDAAMTRAEIAMRTFAATAG
jgi:glutamate-1-semialdehyde 2,1-aminomutase